MVKSSSNATDLKDQEFLQTYLDDQPFYTSQRYYEAEEARPVRPGMLLTLTSGLCFFLTGVGLVTQATKTPECDVPKYAFGIALLIISMFSFLAVAFMCVRHFNRVQQREETLTAIITGHAFADDELLELSIQHIQKQLRRNSKSLNKKRFLPSVVNVISEEQESLNKKKKRLFNNYKQLIKTLS